MNVEMAAALMPADKFTKKETLFIEPKTMYCDYITKVAIVSGLNIFKGTGSIEKYVRSIITDEVKNVLQSQVTGRVCLKYLKR